MKYTIEEVQLCRGMEINFFEKEHDGLLSGQNRAMIVDIVIYPDIEEDSYEVEIKCGALNNYKVYPREITSIPTLDRIKASKLGALLIE